MELLKNKLLLHVTLHNTTVFMHDGAPCHQTKIKKFLGVNLVMMLDWPANSPDLNHIKNLWDEIKDLKSEKQPSSGKALIKRIEEV